MAIEKSLHLYGCHDSLRTSYVERQVILMMDPGSRSDYHTVAYQTFPNSAREALLLDNVVIATWDESKNCDDTTCSEWFQELTGFYPYQWDAAYRRDCWPAYQDIEWYWSQVRPRTPSGYDAMVLAEQDSRDTEHSKNDSQAELVWRTL